MADGVVSKSYFYNGINLNVKTCRDEKLDEITCKSLNKFDKMEIFQMWSLCINAFWEP